jgi:BirA family transcriptional regulator, biotin operon repressor / biotin---[acetyl-CoA-carboxylase] ligase
LPEHSFPDNEELPFIELDSIDSTNNYALRQIHAGLALNGTAYFAKEQSAGKGQRGKIWESAKDAGIILSIVINPTPLLVSQQFWLSACAAVSACEFLRKHGAENIKIKWPNDLYWQDRKAGGILIENIIGGVGHTDPKPSGERTGPGWRWTVIGIGVNINQSTFPSQLFRAVSLKQITGRHYNPAELAKELHRIVCKNFHELIYLGFEKMFETYLSQLYKKGETVKFRKNNRAFEAVVRSVSPDGKLVVQHAIEEEFSFGEVEWLIPTTLPEK